MSDQPRTRRTFLPLVLLLGGLLGAGPFVPRAFAAVEPASIAPALDVPGLAGLLGVALAVAALAGIAVSRRGGRQDTGPRPATADDDGREIDPLLAALRGPAAFAPDDLDTRLGVRTSVGSPASAGDGPRWVRRIDPRREDALPAEPDDAGDGWQATSDGELSRS